MQPGLSVVAGATDQIHALHLVRVGQLDRGSIELVAKDSVVGDSQNLQQLNVDRLTSLLKAADHPFEDVLVEISLFLDSREEILVIKKKEC